MSMMKVKTKTTRKLEKMKGNEIFRKELTMEEVERLEYLIESEEIFLYSKLKKNKIGGIMFDIFMGIVELLNNISYIDKEDTTNDKITNDKRFLNGNKVENFVIDTIINEYENKMGKTVNLYLPKEIGINNLKESDKNKPVHLNRTKKDIENEPLLIVIKPFGDNKHPDFIIVVGNIGMFLECKSNDTGYTTAVNSNLPMGDAFLYYNTQNIIRDRKTKKEISRNPKSLVLISSVLRRLEVQRKLEESPVIIECYKKLGEITDKMNIEILRIKRENGEQSNVGVGYINCTTKYKAINLESLFEPEYRKVIDKYLLFFFLNLCVGIEDYDEKSFDIFLKLVDIYNFYKDNKDYNEDEE